MIKIILICILFSSSINAAFAEEVLNLKALTKECFLAFQNYKPITNEFQHKNIHTAQYEGWSGDADNIELTRPVSMTIDYSDNKKSGLYWFHDHPEKKYNFIVKSDIDGNYELTELIEHGGINYIFHGVLKDGVIKGLWEKGGGKKAYAFYVKEINLKHTTRPRN